MAKGEVAEVENAATVVGYNSGEFEWETVHVESPDQVVFDTIGDTLIGVYTGHELIYPDPEKDPGKWFVQLRWTIPTGAVFTNAGYELRNAYTETTYDSEGRPTVTDKIPTGTMTRNELMKLVDVDQASEMKSFRVDQARPRNADNPA
jgi:hypothetical protein